MTLVPFPDFVWLWAREQGQSMPLLHDRMARWLAECWESGDRQLLLMAFRGSGKSTLVGLFAAWLLCRDPNLRLLVLAADMALARKMVRNVKRLIERHPISRRLALKPRRADQWSAEQFTVARPAELRDPSMLARGIGANLTGSRADIVVCDDVEVPNTCDSAPKRADLRARLAEIDYILVPGGLQLYVGTPHTYYTLYAEEPRREIGESAAFLDGFKRLVLPVLTAEGRSRWPERFPAEAIARIRRHTGANKFQSQMMLEPVSIAEGRLDPDRLRPYEGELEYRQGGGASVLTLNGKRLVSASCWWDPAYGARSDGGDGSVIAALFTDEAGGYHLHRIRYLNAGEGEGEGGEEQAGRQCRLVVEFVRELFLPSVSLEINGLGRFLPGLLRQELKRQGVTCAVIEVSSRQPKHQRIVEAFDVVLAAGALNAHRGVWDTPFVREMRDWRPDARFKGRDDGLDAVAGCLKAEPVRLGGPARPGWGAGANAIVSDAKWYP